MSINLLLLGIATTISPLFILSAVVMMSASGRVRDAWAAVAGLYAKKSGGAFLALLAIVALRLAAWHWSERRRMIGKVLMAERVWNPPAPERPAHTANESDAVIWLTLAVAFGVPAIAAAVHLIWKFNH